MLATLEILSQPKVTILLVRLFTCPRNKPLKNCILSWHVLAMSSCFCTIYISFVIITISTVGRSRRHAWWPRLRLQLCLLIVAQGIDTTRSLDFPCQSSMVCYTCWHLLVCPSSSVTDPLPDTAVVFNCSFQGKGGVKVSSAKREQLNPHKARTNLGLRPLPVH